jgi:hypothetical protein
VAAPHLHEVAATAGPRTRPMTCLHGRLVVIVDNDNLQPAITVSPLVPVRSSRLRSACAAATAHGQPVPASVGGWGHGRHARTRMHARTHARTNTHTMVLHAQRCQRSPRRHNLGGVSAPFSSRRRGARLVVGQVDDRAHGEQDEVRRRAGGPRRRLCDGAVARHSRRTHSRPFFSPLSPLGCPSRVTTRHGELDEFYSPVFFFLPTNSWLCDISTKTW